jgi:hypothetical protein
MKAKGSVMQGYLISNEEGKRCDKWSHCNDTLEDLGLISIFKLIFLYCDVSLVLSSKTLFELSVSMLHMLVLPTPTLTLMIILNYVILSNYYRC